MSATPITPAMGGQGTGGREDNNGDERGVEQKATRRKRPGKKHRAKARRAADAAREAAANSTADADAVSDSAVDESAPLPETDSDNSHQEATAMPSSPPDEEPKEACLDSKDALAPQHDSKEAGGKQSNAVAAAMQRLQNCEEERDEQRGQLAKYEEELTKFQGLQKAAEEETARDKKRVEVLERSLAEAEERLCAEQAANAGLRAELRSTNSAVASSVREKKQLEKEVEEKEQEVEGLKKAAREAKLAFDRRLASLEKALGECAEEMARSALDQENDCLRAELAESQEELVRVNQRLLDSEAELKEERRRRQRSGSEASEAPRGHTRMGSELSQLGGGETPGEGHSGDEHADGKEEAGPPAKERGPLVVFEKRGASVPPSLARARMTVSTGTQTDPAVPPPPTPRKPLPLFRRRGTSAATPPRCRVRSLSGPVGFVALFDTPTNLFDVRPTSGPGPTGSGAAVNAAAHQNREAPTMGGSSEDNGEAAVGADVRAGGIEETPDSAGPAIDPTDPPRDTAGAKPGKGPAVTFVWQRMPTNPFLWLLWLLSILYLVSLVGKEQREWEFANGGSSFAFFDLLDDFLPSDPLMRCLGMSFVGANAYRYHALG